MSNKISSIDKETHLSSQNRQLDRQHSDDTTDDTRCIDNDVLLVRVIDAVLLLGIQRFLLCMGIIDAHPR